MSSWISITLSEVLSLLSFVWFRLRSPAHSLRLRDFDSSDSRCFLSGSMHTLQSSSEEKTIPQCSSLARCTPCRAPNEEKQLKLPKSHSSIHLFIKQKITGKYTQSKHNTFGSIFHSVIFTSAQWLHNTFKITVTQKLRFFCSLAVSLTLISLCIPLSL
jgi:hypothetical protein